MKYYKLGVKASSFYDSKSTLSISNKAVVAIEDDRISSKKIQRALESGHIIEVKESEFKGYETSVEKAKEAKEKGKPVGFKAPDEISDEEEEGGEDELSNMKKEELIKHVQDNYELSEDDLKAFSSKKKEEMLQTIKSWSK